MAGIWWRGSASATEAARADDRSVPLRFVVDSGWRPVVSTEVDGVEVPMLVHANAGFSVMLTHRALRRVTGETVAKERDFGLGHDLELSTAGRGHTTLASLVVAGHRTSNMRCEVFDLRTHNWEGMLGVEWLAEARAIVDFGRAGLRVPGLSEPVSRISAGDWLPVERDPGTGRFTCRLAVAGTERIGRFVVSTVADTTLDLEFATEVGIEVGEPVDVEHGPTGAVVPVYRPRGPLELVADGRPIAPVTPSIYDLYAYSGTSRPPREAATAGYLGADLLLRERAVVDFG